MKRLSINVGHITNSSSCVYSFPKALLEDEEVQTFLKAYDFWGKDYIGRHVGRGAKTLTQTEEGWATVQAEFAEDFYGGSPHLGEKGDLLIISGDDGYEDPPFIETVLSVFMKASERLDLDYGEVEIH